MNNESEQSRTEQHTNHTKGTFTVSIRDMDKHTWNGFRVMALESGETMGDLFRSIYKRLQESDK